VKKKGRGYRKGKGSVRSRPVYKPYVTLGVEKERGGKFGFLRREGNQERGDFLSPATRKLGRGRKEAFFF